MRLLLSRAIPLVAILLLAAVGLGQSTATHRTLSGESASSKQAAAPPPVTDRVLLRLVGAVGTPPPLPPTPRPVAVAIPRTAKKAAPVIPTHVAIGTGQWGLINADRAAAGLPPLQWNACLANIAIGQAQRMAAQGFISHANGRTLDLGCHLGTFASESIGVQWGSIDDAAMNNWFMNDPIHRDNIMGPYHYVGSAWVWGANREAYLAIEFG